MKPIRPWRLYFCGCGTASYAVVRRLARSAPAKSLAGATFIDQASIRDNNIVTCKLYAGHVGRPKSVRLAELMNDRLGGGACVKAEVASVESMDWHRAISSADGTNGQNDAVPIVVIALDDWASRLCVIEDLRTVASDFAAGIISIQVGLDSGQAQVSVFGSAWNNVCPACGLLALPQKEACVLYTEKGNLLRGDLQREADAAALLVAEVIADHLTGPPARDWANTKTNLTVDGLDGSHIRITRKRYHVPGCLGPHSAVVPVRWDLADYQKEEYDADK